MRKSQKNKNWEQLWDFKTLKGKYSLGLDKKSFVWYVWVCALHALVDSSESVVFSAQVLIKSLDLYDYFINSQCSWRCLHLPCGLVVEPPVQVLGAV